MKGLACLFPGQGAQRVGMGADLYAADPDVQALYARARDTLGFDLAEVSFHGPPERLNRTNVCQPAILVASLAVLEVVRKRAPDFAPEATAGLSLGEYTALVCAGALTFEEALRLVERRGALMQEACDARPGTMASVIGLPRDTVEAIVEETPESLGPIGVSNYNAAAQTVVSGTVEAVAHVRERCEAAGARRVVELTVAGAYHSPLMAPARDRLAPLVREADVREPAIGFVSNVTGTWVRDPETIKELLIEQVVAPVRWQESMETLVAGGMTTAYELGPGRVIGGLMRGIDRSVTVRSLDGLEAVEREVGRWA